MEENIIHNRGGGGHKKCVLYILCQNKKNQEKSSSYSMETKRADRVSRDTHEED